MAADCAFFYSLTVFTVYALIFSVDGSVLPILPLVSGFHDGLCTIFLRGWQRIACFQVVNVFHGLRTVLCSRWQRIPHSSTS